MQARAASGPTRRGGGGRKNRALLPGARPRAPRTRSGRRQQRPTGTSPTRSTSP
uniref:Uncharacterized protein n=1 Tax=Arundo donax TaxID=35708 RepID=A0A0A8YMC6_ARUDO